MSKRERLTASTIAARLDIKLDTFWAYVTKGKRERAAGRDRPGLAPPPDGYEELSGRPWWYASTIDRWNANRPGHGARTDLSERAS